MIYNTKKKEQYMNFLEWLKNRTMLEYEQYVDEDGYAHDDEGNSSFVGKQYSGGTYGLHDLPRGYDVPAHRQRKQVDASFVDSIKTVLQKKPNEFLRSILNQVESGRGLTDRQVASAKRAIEGSKPFLPVQTNPFAHVNPNQIDTLEKASSKIDSSFLRSILDQVKLGKSLSEKQKKIVRGILQRLGMKSDADLFL